MDKGIWLVICGMGSGPGVFRIKEGRQMIGRGADCDIHLWHPKVSRRHAELMKENGKLSIHDLGSCNGTFVDGKPVECAEITAGSSLRIGRVTLDVVDQFPDQSPSEEDAEETDRGTVDEPGDVHLRANRLPPVLKRVLILLLKGYGEKQIAGRLGIGRCTVHDYLKEIYKRLGVHSRAQLCAYFRSNDAMPVDQPDSAAHSPALTHARPIPRPQSFSNAW